MLKVMILAGGKGERFWPLSRRRKPKPFLSIGGEESLLRATFRRARSVAPPGAIRVVAGAALAGAVRREMKGLGSGAVLVEPAARNTGPAALLAARIAWAEHPLSEILFLPSDHRVVGLRAFQAAVAAARRLARRGFLVTFGIPPGGPSPDYGYIVPGSRLAPSCRSVVRFVEKPDSGQARRLIRRHGAVWNSGMFVWSAEAFLEEAARYEPSFGRWLSLSGRGKEIPPAARRAFRDLPDIPVDRAVLERSRRVAVVKSGFEWSDLGTWSSLDGVLPRDRGGNLHWGDLVSSEAHDNLAVHPGGLTVLSGVKELLVIRAGNAILVCPRRHATRLREILREVERAGHGEYL